MGGLSGYRFNSYYFSYCVAVWVVALVRVSSGIEYEGCAREGRSFRPRLQVPCDLVKNTFCDTSGDGYPWSQLRKFVFENQGLIKRMYGYQTHYDILKDELLDSLYDGGHQYNPHEMYLKENQLQFEQESPKTRNSVRSNAFRDSNDDITYNKELNTEQLAFPGNEEITDDQIVFLEKGLDNYQLDRNARHIGGSRSFTSRAMKIPNTKQSGRRSITSTSFSKDRLNDQIETKKTSYKSKVRNQENSGKFGDVKITQGYSTKSTSEGVATPSPILKKVPQEHLVLDYQIPVFTEASVSLEIVTDDPKSTEDQEVLTAPSSSASPTLDNTTAKRMIQNDSGSNKQEPPNTTTKRGIQKDSKEVAYINKTNKNINNTKVTSASHTSVTGAGNKADINVKKDISVESDDGKEDATTRPNSEPFEDGDQLTEGELDDTAKSGSSTEASIEAMDENEWVTAGSAAYVYTAEGPASSGSGENPGTTKDPLSSSGPRPPGEVNIEFDLSSAIEMFEDEFMTTTTASEDLDDTTIVYMSEEIIGSKEDTVSSKLPLEIRSSADIELENESHTMPFVEYAGESSTTTKAESSDEFKFPDDESIEMHTQSSVSSRLNESKKKPINNNRRQSNTRRPASSESRQPVRYNNQQPSDPHHQRRRGDVAMSNTNRNQESESSSGQSSGWKQPENTNAQASTIHEVKHRKPTAHQKTGHQRYNHKRPTQQQVVWRRPTVEEVEQEEEITTTSSTSRPLPPTPSTVPTPAPSVDYKKGVNACPVETDVVAPYWANNTRGEVLALLNLSPFEQYVHWEKCRYEYRQMQCRAGCRCEQQYRLHRMLAFDPSNDCRGIFSDWFRFPSGCVCKCYVSEEELYANRGYGAQNRQNLDTQSRPNIQEVTGRQARQKQPDDLTDVYFESPDDLLLLDEEAEERMDQSYSEEDYESDLQDVFSYKSLESDNVNVERKENVEPNDRNIEDLRNKIVENVVAVLEREPVNSLYSRVEATQMKQKIPLSRISPQRRPRPHVISQRRNGAPRLNNPVHLSGSGSQHSYDMRFSPSSRVQQYVSPNPRQQLARFKYHPSLKYRPRSRYFMTNPRYRNINSWNPQASFPTSLSNPRFQKYRDVSIPKQGRSSVFIENPSPSSGLNNLNFKNLMKPAPRSINSFGEVTPQPEGAPGVTYGTVDVHTPHYFFNLTSHLIRSQQLDSKRPSIVYKSREPRSTDNIDQD